MTEEETRKVRALLVSLEAEPMVRRAVSGLVMIHRANSGARFDRDSRGLILLDRLCYGTNQLRAVEPTTRASAHFLLEEIGIRVNVDLDNLPPCKRETM